MSLEHPISYVPIVATSAATGLLVPPSPLPGRLHQQVLISWSDWTLRFCYRRTSHGTGNLKQLVIQQSLPFFSVFSLKSAQFIYSRYFQIWTLKCLKALTALDFCIMILVAYKKRVKRYDSRNFWRKARRRSICESLWRLCSYSRWKARKDI